MFFEIITEMRSFQKTEPARNFFNIQIFILQHYLRLGNGFICNPGADRFTRFTADYTGKVVYMKKLFICIILHPQLGICFTIGQIPEMLLQVLFESFYYLRASV